MQSLATISLQLIDHPFRARIEDLVFTMESWPQMIAMVHRFDRQHTQTSRQVKAVLGYDKAAWDNDFLSSITHEDDVYGINEKMACYLMEAGKPFYDKEGPHIIKLFGRLRHANGRYIPMEFSGVILQYNNKGTFQLGLGVYQDISQRAVNESLKKSSEKLTRNIEKHLLAIKRLYYRMHPHEHGHPAPPFQNGHVSRIHIVDAEQLAIKTRHGIEVQKLLAKHTQAGPHPAFSGTNRHIAVADLQFMNRVLQCIEQHLADPEFATDQLAGKLNMSRGHLYRKVKQAFGIPPTGLLKSMRLDKAAGLLRLTEDSVTSVAFSVGFTDSSYFSKCFRAQYGTTPFAYRQPGTATDVDR